MTLEHQINNMISTLQNHKRTKEDIYTESVENRLVKSNLLYDKELKNIMEYLTLYKNDLQILRNYNK